MIFFFCQNILTFSLIFWLLTWVSEYFFKKKKFLTKKQTYECGFKSIDTLNIQINMNFLLLCIFLVLYDVEFIFLLPVTFNLHNVTLFTYIIVIIIILIIVVSLIYDWQMSALSWQHC